MALDLIAAALILAFAAIAALGHVLLAVAIYKCVREDYIDGRKGRSGAIIGDSGAENTAGAVNLSETLEPQQGHAGVARQLVG